MRLPIQSASERHPTRPRPDRPTRIPQALAFEVAANARIDPIGEAADIVAYGEFADEAALAASKAHPLYVETTRVLPPSRELRWSADFRSALS
jgi:hypothetical protein